MSQMLEEHLLKRKSCFTCAFWQLIGSISSHVRLLYLLYIFCKKKRKEKCFLNFDSVNSSFSFRVEYVFVKAES